MKFLIYAIAVILMAAVLIVLMFVGLSYGQNMSKRAEARGCRKTFDQCYAAVPHWKKIVEIIIVKDVPERYKFLCGYITVYKTYPEQLYKRYIYRYTPEEAKRLNLIDFSKGSRDTNYDKWLVIRDKKRASCKIKEDKCRAKIGFKPRYVDKNLYTAKIFDKYIYNKEIE